MLAALHPATSNPSRMVNYTTFENRYDFDTLTFPVSLHAITPFAKRNGISINVYAIEGAKRVIFPLGVTESPIDGKHIDLLMHELGGIQHYSAIRNFSRLVSGQTGSHQHAIYCCRKCLHGCTSASKLKEHTRLCMYSQCTEFPRDTRCRFTNIHKQLTAPFVVYADFESVLKPLSDCDTTQGVEIGTTSITAYQEHVACSFSYKIVSSILPDFNKPIVYYRGEDAAEGIYLRATA